MDIIDGGNLDSVKYWKDVAAQYKQKSSDLAQELDEFTTNSAQLEKELEVSLVQQEKINRDLVNCNKKLKSEVEQYKVKLERSQKEVLDLEAQIHNYKDDLSKQLTLIRELEQKNDDLERGQRVVSETVTYIETMLNQAYERNAVLESEVDEVEALRVELQRATDEARDLKQELKVKDKIKINGEGENENEATDPLKNIRQVVEANTQTLNISEVNGNGGSETSLSPASRITSLNIIGDILKRVGVLETKLSSARGTTKPPDSSLTSDASKDYR